MMSGGGKQEELLDQANSVLQMAMVRLEEELIDILSKNKQSFEPDYLSFHSCDEDVSSDVSLVSTEAESIEETSRRNSGGTEHEDHKIDLVHPCVISDIKSIANVMFASHYDQEFCDTFVSFWKDVLDEYFVTLRFEKLSIEELLKMESKQLCSKIKIWNKAMKFIIRVYLASEKRLFDQVLGEFGSTYKTCFIEASKDSMLCLLNFGEAMVFGPREPHELFRLLDMYEVLSNLIPDVNTLFSEEAGSFLRTEFHQLLIGLGGTVKATLLKFGHDVASHPSTYPFPAGGIHLLSRYVMNYVNTMAEYSDTLNLLLRVQSGADTVLIDLCPWASYLRLLTSNLESNIDNKSQLYRDPMMKHIFMMNNIHYMVRKIRGSALEEFYGVEWIKEYTRKFQQHKTSYERVIWSPVLSLVRDDGKNGKAVLRERLRGFNIAIEEVYKSQTTWSIPDDELRKDVRISTSQKVIQAYRTFTGTKSAIIGKKFIKYTANELENRVLDLFEGLLGDYSDQQIIIPTTNHNHRDRYQTALPSPLNIDAYMHTSSPQPIALPDGGEIVELDSSEQKPLVDFDATNNRAYQSSVLVSNSEKENTRETSKRRCMTESVLSSDDSRTRISLTDFVAPGLSSSCGDERITVSTTNHRDPHDAALLPLVNMETDIHTASPQLIALPDGGETVQLESIEQKPLVDFAATNNRAYQSGVLVSSKKKNTVEAYKGQWESLIQRTKKDLGERSNEECLTKSALSLDDSTEQNSIDHRWGRSRLHSMEHEQPATFAELGTDPENEGIVYDLLRFVREKEFYKRVGKAWKRGYLLYDPPCTNRSNLMAYMANCLEFDVHDLDLTGLSSIEELTNVLVSIRNGSLIVIKDFDHWVGMLPNLKNEQLTLSGLLEIIHGLLSSCGDERIIILTTNHNHIDRVDAALLCPLNIDLCLHTSSPQPIAVADGGEIVQLDSSEQKPMENFDATSNRAYQSDILVSISEGKSTREASRRQCMPESVLTLVDSMTRISSMDFNAPNSSAHLGRADQSGLIVFNSETKDSGEGLNRECLTKSVLSLDDSSRQKSLPEVDATKNKAHLVRAYQKGLVVSLSENKNRGEALKRECITRSVLDLEDLQQHFGGRRNDAAKNFGAIYDPGIHTKDSLARKSVKVVETLPIWEQPNDCAPLLSIGKLTLKCWVQEDKSPNLPRVLQLNIVEQRVTKLPICLEGLTAESARASCWPISLPDGRHIVVLHPLEQSTKNIAHAARVDQCSPTVSLPEKKMVRKTLKRECRTMSVREIHQQHFGRRCEGSARNFRATRIGGKHVTNRLSTEKRIHRIHQWPFRQCVKAGESGPTVSNSEKGSLREALKRDSLRDLRQHFGTRHKDAVKAICDSLAWKSLEVLDSLSLGKHSNSIRHLDRRRTLTNKHCVRLKNSQDPPRSLRSDCSGELAAQSALGIPDGGHIPSLPEKKTVRKTLKRKSRTMSALSLEDHQQHVGRRWEDDAKFLGAKRICRQLAIDSRSTEKRILRQHGTRWCQFKQSAIDLPDGGHIRSLSKKRIVRKTLKRKCRNMSVLRSEYHQHVDSKWEDAVKSLGAKHIYRQLVSRAKRVCGQHVFHRWPFQPNWATLKGYFLGDERPVVVISLSTDGKLVSRLQLIHISWLGRFSPRPPALPPGGEIVEPPIALSSSQLPSTSNRAHLGGQDRSGSTTSHSQNERTRDQPEGRKRKIKNLTIEDLQPYVGLTRANAAKKFLMSETTFKRQCRRLKIEQWPKLPPGEEVLKPPDPPERNTGQIAMVNEVGHLPEPTEVSRPPYHEPNEFLQDYIDGRLCGEENDSMDFQLVWQAIEAAPVRDESPSCTAYPNPNPDVFLQTQVTSTHMVSGTMGIPNDHRNSLASQAETRLEEHGTRSSLSQRIQDMSFVTLKVYGLDTIKFKFPLTSGINELKGEVAKRLNLEPDSFNMKYEDEEGEQILIPLSEDLRDYLSSSITPVIKLWVVSKVANLTNLCESCGGSLKQ